MSYNHLRKLSYENRDNFMKEVELRTNNTLAAYTSLLITPFQREQKVYGKTFELFYLPINDLSKLKETLFLNSKKIIKLQENLPNIAQKKVFLGNLLEEIKSTNDIEGVQSSRKEINDAIDDILQNKKSKKRFNGIVKLYMRFQDSEFSEIKKIEDIRSIYDELLDDEIEEENLPDGELFRLDKVYVKKNGRSIHQGVGSGEPGEQLEDQIKEQLLLLVNFMNSHEFPSIEKCLISHYFLEYIHPFYDGNGRLGRFIACSYLSRKLDYLSAISFSTSIKKKRGVYGQAFSEVSNPRNYGEITGFLIDMITLLVEGQQSVIDELTEGKRMLEIVDEYLNSLSLSKSEKYIMFILLQDYLFSRTAHIEDRDILDILNKDVSRRDFKKSMDILVEKDFLKQIKQKPSVHIFSDSFVETINGL